MQRSNYIDFSKGMLILLVCIGHAIQCAAYHEIDFFQDPLFKAIYMFHMPLFIGISGYLSFSGIIKSNSSDFFYSKITSLLLPILVWQTLIKVVITLASRRGFDTDFPLLTLTAALQNLWFLWALLACLLLTKLASSCGKYSMLVSMATFIIMLSIPDYGILPLIKYTFPYFLIGYYISSFNLTATLISFKKTIFIFCALLSIIFYYFWNENTYVYVTGMRLSQENLPNIILRYVAGITASAVALGIFYAMYKNIGGKIKTILISFGKDSLYIYIIGQYTYIIVTRVAARYFERVDHPLAAAAISICIGFGITSACWAIGNIMVKNKILAKMFFGKTSLKHPVETRIVK